ncbi:MAG TPA: acyltransferase, partial [Polyangiaceae bacterium]|nr:acyltransferase [Polyangiaceae bacterium]
LPHASEAFLDPAWSISLEWQFYLVAPLCFALATKSLGMRLLLCLVCAAVVLVRPWLPGDLYGASLPFHIEFFFLGGASYFFFKHGRGRAPRATPLIVLAAIVLLVGVTRGHPHALAPVYVWAVMLSLLCARPDDRSRVLLARPLEHPWAQVLGRLSYSVYLAHLPLMAVVQFALLNLAPGLDRVSHFALLFAGTLLVTLPMAAVLYAAIEAPFIRWGNAIAQAWAHRRASIPVPARARLASWS